ncbi:MAG: prolipoprotein diacylglyceryl transferase [Bryobacteraceae bacterium]|nr:prolipoprotein diacylglyceryl transferase [Bryobacteraceae bacterium]
MERSVSLPVFGTPAVGAVLMVCGIALLISGMVQLWIEGGGLPMNAFPPPRYASAGIFRLIPHPIYAGFTMMCFGVSMVSQSPAALWIVSPTVALGCAALVLGYESLDLRRRFPNRAGTWLPGPVNERPLPLDHLRFVAFSLAPWCALYTMATGLGTPADGFDLRLAWERQLPVIEWTEAIYLTTYLGVPLASLMAPSQEHLRMLMIRSWIAMLIAFPIYGALPVLAPRPDFTPATLLGQILEWERGTYPPVAAFPSFHVIWSVLVAELFVSGRGAVLAVARVWAAAVAVSCVTTGMHSLADVFGGGAVAVVSIASGRVWNLLRNLSEYLANSWAEWRIGPVRVINHAVYAGLAGGLGIAIARTLAGPGTGAAVITIGLAAIAGAALWAQLVEGSHRLLRPFGFYGGLAGVAAAVWMGSALADWDGWLLCAACCTASPVMQAAGRLRCLVQGCCHGSPVSPDIGIRYWRPHSRVVRIAGWKGVPLHPTPLYSILWNILVMLALGRMWVAGAPLHMICGVFVILTGAGRFVEEAYRGEPQTVIYAGLRLYQWVAIATVLLGAWVTGAVNSAPAPTPQPAAESAWLGLLFAVLCGVAMGVDLPNSNSRFSRLT